MSQSEEPELDLDDYNTDNIKWGPPPTKAQTQAWITRKLQESKAGLKAKLTIPLEDSAKVEWAQELFTNLIVTPKQWQDFVTSFGPDKETNPIDNLLDAARLLELSRNDVNRGINLILDRAASFGQPFVLSWEKLSNWWKESIKVFTNPEWKEEEYLNDPNYAVRPGFFDNSRGRVIGPTLALSPEKRDQNVEETLRHIFGYEELSDGTVFLTDAVFLRSWAVMLENIKPLIEYLDALDLALNFAYKMIFDEKNLKGNKFPRPSGVWDRKRMGYTEYFYQKYGKVYPVLGPDFLLWPLWDNPELTPSPTVEMVEAVHTSITGIIRGIIPFILELYLDISLKANTLGLVGIPTTKDWALLEVPEDRDLEKLFSKGSVQAAYGKIKVEPLKKDTVEMEQKRKEVLVQIMNKYPEIYDDKYSTLEKGQVDWNDEEYLEMLGWRTKRLAAVAKLAPELVVQPGFRLESGVDNQLSETLEDASQQVEGTPSKQKRKKNKKKKGNY